MTRGSGGEDGVVDVTLGEAVAAGDVGDRRLAVQPVVLGRRDLVGEVRGVGHRAPTRRGRPRPRA